MYYYIDAIAIIILYLRTVYIIIIIFLIFLFYVNCFKYIVYYSTAVDNTS
jgi:hypothetical protein